MGGLRVENAGRAAIKPGGAVVAATHGTWTVRYTAGIYGVDDAGHIRIAQRQVSDWQQPQLERPADSGYVTACTNAEARLELHFFPNMHERPFRRALQVTVVDGALAPGDWVEVTYGDTSGGGPGLRVQTFAELRSEFRVFVDPFGANRYVPVAEQPWLEVVAGPAARLEIMAPSDGHVGRPFEFAVRAVDAWGNTAKEFEGEVALAASLPVERLPGRTAFARRDRGVLVVSAVRPRAEGDLIITAACSKPEMAGESNTIRCHASPHKWGLYWGDLHGQSMETVGTNPAREYLRFAKEDARLDFVGHQGNDFQITREFWAELTDLMREFHEPGRFVTFLGYEWSGNTPNGGDHNVHFLGDVGDLHRSSHALLDDLSDAESDRSTLPALRETFAGREDVMLVPHVGGRRANLKFFDPALASVVEIHSSHGAFEWFGLDALRRGLQVGFICGSDVHSGKPGASRPSAGAGMEAFGVCGGLAAVYAEGLTREAIWEALKARRCYGTTGERMAVWFECNRHPMGSRLPMTKELAFKAAVRGTAPIHSLEILRAGELVFEARPRSGSRRPGRLRVTWSGADGRGRRRGTNWNGGLQLTGAAVRAVETVGFDHPDERVTSWNESAVEWLSATAGDLDGLELVIHGGRGAEVRFAAGPARFVKRLDEIGERPWRFDAGGIERRVELEWVDVEGESRAVDLSHAVEGQSGAYYLKVVQKDCQMAWTSPIYVEG